MPLPGEKAAVTGTGFPGGATGAAAGFAGDARGAGAGAGGAVAGALAVVGVAEACGFVADMTGAVGVGVDDVVGDAALAIQATRESGTKAR
jgi:hypothetical protein